MSLALSSVVEGWWEAQRSPEGFLPFSFQGAEQGPFSSGIWLSQGPTNPECPTVLIIILNGLALKSCLLFLQTKEKGVPQWNPRFEGLSLRHRRKEISVSCTLGRACPSASGPLSPPYPAGQHPLHPDPSSVIILGQFLLALTFPYRLCSFWGWVNWHEVRQR